MDEQPVQLSAGESRLLLQAIRISIAHEWRAGSCRQEQPSLEMQDSIREREQQITQFEKLRQKIGGQL